MQTQCKDLRNCRWHHIRCHTHDAGTLWTRITHTRRLWSYRWRHIRCYRQREGLPKDKTSPPPIKPSSKPSNSLPSALCVSSPGGPNNAANRTAAAVSDRKASLRSQNKTLNPFQVSSAARPAPKRAVVRQIAKKSAKPARAGAKKTTELETARAKKKNDCQRNSVNRARKCEHNRRATRCPDCVRSSGDGFRSLCPHWKQKGWCTQCKMDDSETAYYGEARR